MALIVVAGLFAVLQLALGAGGRPLAYDEAVYLAQVRQGGPAVEFTAPRARGLVWLAAPVAEAPLVVVRSYLLALTAMLLVAAFRAWVPVAGHRAVLAAAAFAVGWPTLFFASQLFPNTVVALGAVATAGFLARHLADEPRALAKAAGSLALVGVVRPTEATFVAVGLALAAAGSPRRKDRRWLVLGTGLAAGWLPWLVEAFLAYGTPAQRLAAASTNVGGGFTTANVIEQLRLTDGPPSGPTDAPVPPLGVLWWGLLGLGAVLALLAVLRGDRRGSVPALAGLASAAQYLFLTDVVEARFLLPAEALLVTALVVAAPSLRVRNVLGTVGAMVTCAAAVTGAAVASAQVDTAIDVAREQDRVRVLSGRLSDALARRVGTVPCYFVSEYNFPQIALDTGCQGELFRRTQTRVALRTDPGDAEVWVLSRTNPNRLVVRPAAGTVDSLAEEGLPGWWVFPVPGAEVQVVEGDDGPTRR